MENLNLRKAKAPSVQAGGSQDTDHVAVRSRNFTGRLPSRQNTVLAAVLASMLEGRHLTGMDAVFGESTTRLAHHIWAIRGDYGWDVHSVDRVVGTKDGRVETIAVYSLPPEVIEVAMAQGARGWIDEVRRQRLALRRKAAEARRKAERFEVSKRLVALVNPAQFNLFGGGA